jgi:hypothetical protein
MSRKHKSIMSTEIKNTTVSASVVPAKSSKVDTFKFRTSTIYQGTVEADVIAKMQTDYDKLPNKGKNASFVRWVSPTFTQGKHKGQVLGLWVAHRRGLGEVESAFTSYLERQGQEGQEFSDKFYTWTEQGGKVDLFAQISKVDVALIAGHEGFKNGDGYAMSFIYQDGTLSLVAVRESTRAKTDAEKLAKGEAIDQGEETDETEG